MATAQPIRPAGQLLRAWRRRRKLSRLDLSRIAAISSRHLSFVETGRAGIRRVELDLRTT
jgi:hypothetical protein